MRTTLLFAIPLLFGCPEPGPPPISTPAAATASSELQVGKAAPPFDVTASDGTKLKLSDLKGKPVVLYFYPKDETPGCTKEACSFRDGWDALQKKGVVMIGVSMDDDASHKAFAEHYKLPFLLVSDPTGALAQSYGVTIIDHPKYGKMTDRQTIVIGTDGNVKRIYRTVDVTVHAAEIQADLSVVTALSVTVDGVPMPEEEARAFWKRFSAHMEAHKGDLAGFAKAEGYASVHPAVGPDGPRIVVSRTAPQGPYRNVSSGSKTPHPGGDGRSLGRKSRRK